MIDKLLSLQPNAVERVAAMNDAELKARRVELHDLEQKMIVPKGEKKTKQAINVIKKKAKTISENQATIAPAKSAAMKFHKNFTALGKWVQDYVKINKDGDKRNDPLEILKMEITDPVGSSKATMRGWFTGLSQGIEIKYPVKERGSPCYMYKGNIVDPGFIMPAEKASRFDRMIEHDIEVMGSPNGWNFKTNCIFPVKRGYYCQVRHAEGEECNSPAIVSTSCLSAGKIGTVNAMECNVSPIPEKVEMFYKTANKLLDKFAGQIHGKIDEQIQQINKDHAKEMKGLDEQIAVTLARRPVA